MYINKVFIFGNLTRDPELRSLPSGMNVVNFSVATNRVFRDRDGKKQEQTEFHNVVVWGRQAEIVGQFLTKGSTILVEGRLQTRSWQDKQGQTRKTTEIISDRIQLGPRPQGVGTARPVGGFAPQGGSPMAGTASTSSASQPKEPPVEELPTIDMDEPGAGEIKPEDLPF